MKKDHVVIATGTGAAAPFGAGVGDKAAVFCDLPD